RERLTASRVNCFSGRLAAKFDSLTLFKLFIHVIFCLPPSLGGFFCPQTAHPALFQLINNPCAGPLLLHKISLCVECFLINNSADTPEKRESVLMPEMPT
ncbi:hypothetical protein EIA23_29335, partial [Escherichia coli]